MPRFIDEVFDSEFTLGKKITIKGIDLLVFIAITVIAIGARIVMFSYVSRDYTVFLSEWYKGLEMAGGFKGIGLSLGDYTPAYVYIMAIISNLPVDNFIATKVVSCIFDFVAAFMIMKLVFSITVSPRKSILSYAVFLFAPTIALNGALWAQCDVIFTLFLIYSIYYWSKEKPVLAMIFFGIAISFKLQAIFLAPLLVIMWLSNKCKLRHFLLIPAVYLITIIPAFIMGRPLMELLTIYFSQAGQYKELSLNAPNLYMWINSDKSSTVAGFGIMLCLVTLICIAYIVIDKKIDMDTNNIILFALLFSLLVPFLLPHMHERYFYLADTLAIIYAFTSKKRYFIPIIVVLSSLASYTPYLFGVTAIDLKIVALAILFAIAVVIKDIVVYNKLESNNSV